MEHKTKNLINPTKVKSLLFTSFLLLSSVANAGLKQDINNAIHEQSRPARDIKLDVDRKPAQVLAFFQIKKGMNVIDVFSGEGYYTEILSHLVGESGSVAMHNHSVWEAYSKKGSDARIEGGRLANVYQVMQDLNNTKLKPNHYDAATVVLGMHDLFLKSEKSESGEKINVAAFLSSLFKGIKPGGVVGVVEHENKLGTTPEKSAELHRLSSKVIIDIMEQAGFIFEAESNILRNKNDDYNKVVWSEGLRRKTDRAVMRFRKPS